MRPVDIPQSGDSTVMLNLDDTTVANLTNRIAGRSWTIECNRLRTILIETTPSYSPVGCCPVGALALDTAPEYLRKLLEEPEHAITANVIKNMPGTWLHRCLEELHDASDEPRPDENQIIRLATALVIHDNPVSKFASAVTGFDLSTIELIADASDNVETSDGTKLSNAVAKARGEAELAVDTLMSG